LTYQFPPDDSLEYLLARLEGNLWWGEIVGPHGSGKSTLLHSLRKALSETGRSVHQFTLTRGERRLPIAANTMSGWDHQTQVIIDGYEQLNWWQRWWLKRACRKHRCGLLITAHSSHGFPRLWNATTSLAMTQQLVADQLSEHAVDHISPDEIAAAFARHNGNVREVFFDLNDYYEQIVGESA